MRRRREEYETIADEQYPAEEAVDHGVSLAADHDEAGDSVGRQVVRWPTWMNKIASVGCDDGAPGGGRRVQDGVGWLDDRNGKLGMNRVIFLSCSIRNLMLWFEGVIGENEGEGGGGGG